MDIACPTLLKGPRSKWTMSMYQKIPSILCNDFKKLWASQPVQNLIFPFLPFLIKDLAFIIQLASFIWTYWHMKVKKHFFPSIKNVKISFTGKTKGSHLRLPPGGHWERPGSICLLFQGGSTLINVSREGQIGRGPVYPTDALGTLVAVVICNDI